MGPRKLNREIVGLPGTKVGIFSLPGEFGAPPSPPPPVISCA